MVSFGGLIHALLSLIQQIVRYLIPSYLSHKALETHTGIELWVTYWCVAGFVAVLEYVFFFIFDRIPLITVGRIAFFLWLQLPQTKGAHIIYSMLQPVIRQHSIHIDNYVEASKQSMTRQMTQLGLLRPEDVHAAPNFGLSAAVNRFSPAGASAYRDLENPAIDMSKAN